MCVTTAGTSQEWEAALEMLDKQSVRPKQTVGADKGYDVKRFVDEVRDKNFTPHVAVRVKEARWMSVPLGPMDTKLANVNASELRNRLDG